MVGEMTWTKSTIRIPDLILRDLREEAERNKVSLNTHLLEILADRNPKMIRADGGILDGIRKLTAHEEPRLLSVIRRPDLMVFTFLKSSRPLYDSRIRNLLAELKRAGPSLNIRVESFPEKRFLSLKNSKAADSVISDYSCLGTSGSLSGSFALPLLDEPFWLENAITGEVIYDADGRTSEYLCFLRIECAAGKYIRKENGYEVTWTARRSS